MGNHSTVSNDLGGTDENFDLRFARLTRGRTDSIHSLYHFLLPDSEVCLQCS